MTLSMQRLCHVESVFSPVAGSPSLVGDSKLVQPFTFANCSPKTGPEMPVSRLELTPYPELVGTGDLVFARP
jgi:hypothetical protein